MNSALKTYDGSEGANEPHQVVYTYDFELLPPMELGDIVELTVSPNDYVLESASHTWDTTDDGIVLMYGDKVLGAASGPESLKYIARLGYKVIVKAEMVGTYEGHPDLKLITKAYRAVDEDFERLKDEQPEPEPEPAEPEPEPEATEQASEQPEPAAPTSSKGCGRALLVALAIIVGLPLIVTYWPSSLAVVVVAAIIVWIVRRRRR